MSVPFEATDFYFPPTAYIDWDDNKAHTDKEPAERGLSWLQSNTDYNKSIIESSNGNDFWIHISYRKNKFKNHHQTLMLTKK